MYPCFEIIQVHALVLKLDFIKIEFQCKTRFFKNRVWDDQTLKKKKKKQNKTKTKKKQKQKQKQKKCRELELMELEFHIKRYYRMT